MSVFCDDIRHEVGEKISLIGVYAADLVVPRMPITLPKLCVWSVIGTDIERPFSRLVVKLVQEGKPTPLIESLDLAPEAREWYEKSRQDFDDSVEHLHYGLEFAVVPFQIDATTSLRVIAETDSGILKGRRLRIRASGRSADAKPSPVGSAE